MDLYHVAQATLDFLQPLIITVVVGLVGMAARQTAKHTGFTLSQDMQTAIDGEIDKAVTMAVGIGRARLASGEMQLSHVSLGNPFLDQLARLAVDSLSETAKESGITPDDIARQILAGIGHALGDDPTVPTLAPAPAPVKSAPAAPVTTDPKPAPLLAPAAG